MKRIKLLPIVVTVLILAGLITCYAAKDDSKTVNHETINSGTTISKTKNSGTIGCIYYNPEDFKKSVSNVPKRQMDQLKIKGGIVPHHLLASRMMADFFKVLSSQTPEVVVVIGPDHKGLGAGEVSTADLDWSTPYGILQVEKELVGRLADKKSAQIENGLFVEEHSISVLVPYIKYYLPKAKILPLLIKGNRSLEKSIELGQEMAKLVASRNYIIIASVDFSHYLEAMQADKMDELTLKVIENRDLQTMSRMGNDNLDSPPAVISLLASMDAAGAEKFIVLGHNNSARISGANTGSTTSYFTMVFY